VIDNLIGSDHAALVSERFSAVSFTCGAVLVARQVAQIGRWFERNRANVIEPHTSHGLNGPKLVNDGTGFSNSYSTSAMPQFSLALSLVVQIA
jgi:hypothetical protein